MKDPSEAAYLESATAKWKQAAQGGGTPSREPEEVPRPARAPEDREEGRTRPDSRPERVDIDSSEVRKMLALVDGVTRKALDLPEREGVDLELSDADSLELAAELVTPWAQEHAGAFSSGIRATAGVGLIVGELLVDGAWEQLADYTAEVQQGPEGEELDVPDKDPDF